ncbi:hypothetical protein Mal15_50080 [Stieleria maiorica]|uniref:YcxB-like protein domain-containing protein n=1 Tax=Stieleria maiorica TaxID=2795974 RepID=A0A5B9MI02_9BACT|nr:hypothetical protein [Stieleria maiorica]QEG00932.1 hypothetical protein Mal15_50080 [Stieleria maiorica]
MTPNPYQAPPSDSFAGGASPPPSHFVPRRLEFQGELTRQHHRDAVTRAGIRTDYRTATRGMLALAGAYALATGILTLALGDVDFDSVARVTLSTLVLVAGILVFCRHQRWLIGTRIPGFQLATGPIRGWIDGDGLWIETEQSKAYQPLSKLVACAATHDLWVLSFAKELTFWQTLPIDAFTDPALARSVAADLQRAFPPAPPQMIDPRKQASPEGDCLFSTVGDAVRFEGPFYEDDAQGTRLLKATKQTVRRTWFSLAVLLISLLVSILILAGFRTLYLGLAFVWIGFLLTGIVYRVRRTRREASENGRLIAWCSKGWLDDEGYFAMTSLGQTRAAWQFFDHYEITDDTIGLYPHPNDTACCLVSRAQFAGANDWDRATAMVRSKVAPSKDCQREV